MRNSKRRTGVTALEMTVSLLILSAVILIGTQLLSLAGHQRRAATRRAVALNEAGNVMERLAALPWEKTNDSSIANWPVSDQAQQQLPGARVNVQVIDQPSSGSSDGSSDGSAILLTAKQMVVEVAWRNSAGQQTTPIRLTAWKFSPSTTSVERPPATEEVGQQP